eukprot:6207067-Pleurochrysis_carterae.AAC.2
MVHDSGGEQRGRMRAVSRKLHLARGVPSRDAMQNMRCSRTRPLRACARAPLVVLWMQARPQGVSRCLWKPDRVENILQSRAVGTKAVARQGVLHLSACDVQRQRCVRCYSFGVVCGRRRPQPLSLESRHPVQREARRPLEVLVLGSLQVRPAARQALTRSRSHARVRTHTHARTCFTHAREGSNARAHKL